MVEQERMKQLKELINRIADSYAEPEKEKVKEMQELTGVDWVAEDIQMICCEYWESPHSLDEVAYYLIHEKWVERLSFDEASSILNSGKASPFLCALSEEMETENELHITICGAEIGEIVTELDDIPDFSPVEPLNTRIKEICKHSRPITPNSQDKYEIVFENYIIYQVRNESFCSFDPEEVRIGKYLIIFEKSKLLDYLSLSTDASRCKDGSFHPGEWKHYGIYTQRHVIDVVSHCPPKIYAHFCKQ